MKKGILLIAITLFFLLFTSTGYASTKTWLVDENGEEQSGYNIVEIGDSVELGKIRFRQDNETVGLFKEGDRITITLRNALFNSPPILENPIPSLNNDAGQTGRYFLVPLESYSGTNVNSITYQLKEKSIDEYSYNYENIDYLFNFHDIKPINTGEIIVEFSGDSEVILPTGPLVSNSKVLIAKIQKKNTINSNTNSKVFVFEKMGTEIKSDLEKNPVFSFNYKNITFYLPKSFFETGAMWDFFYDSNPYNLIVKITEYSDLETVNSNFSKKVNSNIYELEFIIKNRISLREIPITEGLHYNGVELSVNTLQFNDQKNLIPIKYVLKEDGAYEKKLYSYSVQDNLRKEIRFRMDGPITFSIEQRATKNISMKINDYISRIDNIIKNLDVPPTLINNSTYVPIRFIAENLGAEVEFLQATNQVEIKTGEKTIYLPINKATAELATPARIIEGRTMVPVRYVSEQLGATVTYFADTRKIEIIK